MSRVDLIKKLVLSGVVLIVFSACGSGNGESNKEPAPKAPQTVEIETPPMPGLEQKKD